MPEQSSLANYIALIYFLDVYAIAQSSILLDLFE